MKVPGQADPVSSSEPAGAQPMRRWVRPPMRGTSAKRGGEAQKRWCSSPAWPGPQGYTPNTNGTGVLKAL